MIEDYLAFQRVLLEEDAEEQLERSLCVGGKSSSSSSGRGVVRERLVAVECILDAMDEPGPGLVG